MGADQQTTIGPYLEITGKLTTTEIKIKRECPKHRQLKQSELKFCGYCGTGIESVDVPFEKEVYPKNILNATDFEDNLFSPNGMTSILLPNDSPDDDIDWDAEEGGALNLFSIEMDELKKTQIIWFKKTYEDEITLLREKYGHNNVQIRWGVVSYWS